MSRLPSLMRRIEVAGPSLALGPVFWLADESELSRLNLSKPEAAIPPMSRMANDTRADADEYTRTLLRTGKVPAPAAAGALLSERSVYVQSDGGGTRPRGGSVPVSLVMLLRDDGPAPTLREWASLCQITVDNREEP